MFSKMISNRSEQRLILIRLLETLIKLGYDRTDMEAAFPNYDKIDPFVYKFSVALDTTENFH